MERAVQMKRNLNVSFLEAFVRLDVLCSQKFGVKHGGVTEYINRLINARFAPERDEILPALVEYRNIRNRLVHEEGELAEEGRGITYNDLQAMRDPFSGLGFGETQTPSGSDEI